MFFSKKPESELILIIDVQSSVVRGSLVLIRDSQPLDVVFSHEKIVPYRVSGGSPYLIKMSLRAVNEAIEAVLRHLSLNGHASGLPKKIRAVHYVLSSPWIVSQAKTISVDLPKEGAITQARVMELVEKERATLVPESNKEVTPIEEKVFDVRLNGYSVANWQNREARHVDISFVMSLAGAAMMDRFREACRHVVPARRISFHSSLLLQTIAIERLMPDRTSYTLIHVHGELTDVVSVSHGHCVFFGSYPIGDYTVIRKVAHGMKTDLHAADSLLSLHGAKHVDASERRTGKDVIEDVSKGWSAELDKLFAGEAAAAPLREVVISSRGHEEFFVESFKKAHPESQLEILSFDHLASRVRYGTYVEKLRQTGLYAVAIHAIM